MGAWLVFDSIDDSLLSYKSYKIISESSLAKSQYKIAWNIHGSLLYARKIQKNLTISISRKEKRGIPGSILAHFPQILVKKVFWT